MKRLVRSFGFLVLSGVLGAYGSSHVLAAAAGQAAAVGSLSGTASSSTGQVVTNTVVQLRNLATGQLAGSTTSNVAGQFSFIGLNPGNYAVEVVNAAGQIVGTSASVAVSAGAAVTGVSVTASAAVAATAGVGAAQVLWRAQGPVRAQLPSSARPRPRPVSRERLSRTRAQVLRNSSIAFGQGGARRRPGIPLLPFFPLTKLKPKTFSAALFLLCVVPAAALAQPPESVRMHLGPLFVNPTIALTNAGVDTNVFNEATQDSPKEDFTLTLAPATDAWLRMGRSWLNATVREDIVYYQKYRERALRQQQLQAELADSAQPHFIQPHRVVYEHPGPTGIRG